MIRRQVVELDVGAEDLRVNGSLRKNAFIEHSQRFSKRFIENIISPVEKLDDVKKALPLVYL